MHIKYRNLNYFRSIYIRLDSTSKQKFYFFVKLHQKSYNVVSGLSVILTIKNIIQSLVWRTHIIFLFVILTIAFLESLRHQELTVDMGLSIVELAIEYKK